jgi:hypothetical protein
MQGIKDFNIIAKAINKSSINSKRYKLKDIANIETNIVIFIAILSIVSYQFIIIFIKVNLSIRII